MYALKIENGKERIWVRSYASAFIPSYTSAAEDSMGKRLFVVPGYIFLPKMIPAKILIHIKFVCCRESVDSGNKWTTVYIQLLNPANRHNNAYLIIPYFGALS